MTILPSGSWIWQNGHCRSIRNGPNSREPVWLCREWVRNGLNRSKNQFWASGGSLGLNREYSIGSAASRLHFAAAWLDYRLRGSARRGYGARVDHSSSTSGARGRQCWIFRRRVWDNSISDQADFCAREFVWMRSTLWNDQKWFLTTLKIRISPKTLLFSDERGSDTNCWWEEPLVVVLQHSKGIKHTVLFQEQKLTTIKQKLWIHTLFFSLVFLSIISHTE